MNMVSTTGKFVFEVPPAYREAMGNRTSCAVPIGLPPDVFDSNVGTNQHYVPQLYIRKFLATKSSLIWRLDKLHNSNKILSKPPRRICSEAGYYDFPIGYGKILTSLLDHLHKNAEERLSALYECLMPVIEAAKSAVEIQDGVKLRLSLAMVQLHIRAPGGRSLVEPIYRSFKAEYLAGKVNFLIQCFFYKLIGHAGIDFFNWSREMGAFHDNVEWTDTQLKTLAHGFLMVNPDLIYHMANQLEQCAWTILKCPPGDEFLGSDRPVLQQGVHWGAANTIWAWPINNKYCLAGRFLSNNGPVTANTTECIVRVATCAEVAWLNALRIEKATRFVFASSVEPFKRARTSTNSSEFFEKFLIL